MISEGVGTSFVSGSGIIPEHPPVTIKVWLCLSSCKLTLNGVLVSMCETILGWMSHGSILRLSVYSCVYFADTACSYFRNIAFGTCCFIVAIANFSCSEKSLILSMTSSGSTPGNLRISAPAFLIWYGRR